MSGVAARARPTRRVPRWRRSAQARQRGQAMLEAAIVLPLLVSAALASLASLCAIGAATGGGRDEAAAVWVACALAPFTLAFFVRAARAHGNIARPLFAAAAGGAAGVIIFARQGPDLI